MVTQTLAKDGAKVNSLKLTAQAPLRAGEDLRSSESVGFKKTKIDADKFNFNEDVFDYDVRVPKGTTHVAVMATTFSQCKVKINSYNGNMNTIDIRGGADDDEKNVIRVSIHEQDESESLCTYVIKVSVSSDDDDTTFDEGKSTIVLNEKEVPTNAQVHSHSHDGVPCTKDHAKEEGHHHDDDGHNHHAHSHDGGKTECTADHGHGHGAAATAEKKKEEEHNHHAHSHDGGKTECTHDHVVEKKEEKHSHSHGGEPCTKDHSKEEDDGHHGHSHNNHGHGHGEKKEEEKSVKHSHGGVDCPCGNPEPHEGHAAVETHSHSHSHSSGHGHSHHAH